MGINVPAARTHANTISYQASTLRTVKIALDNFKLELNSHWEAREMMDLNLAIDSMISGISRIIPELDSLSSEIVSVANQIHREEEEARARAAAEAAAAAAAREAALRQSLESNAKSTLQPPIHIK